jgi:hypothetical protein
MNWRLIALLSVFGLVMGLATVFVVPSSVEPIGWLAVFVISAYCIAQYAPGRYFLHGLAVSLANCVWVTGSHVLLFRQYAANHAAELEMMRTMPMANHPRLLMLVTGPVIGLVSGIVLGLFALVAHKLVGGRSRPVGTAD